MIERTVEQIDYSLMCNSFVALSLCLALTVLEWWYPTIANLSRIHVKLT